MAGGPPEIFVRSLATSGAKWRVSTGGGGAPRWRRDGKELFYLAADGTLMAVSIDTSAGAFRHGTAKPLFQTGRSMLPGGQRPVNVSPDGQRFLVLTSAAQARPSSIVVVSNWPALLKR